jgi:hypothetical protein
MLVPVMSGNETGGEGDEGNRVIGIIMVASSERTYTSGPLFSERLFFTLLFSAVIVFCLAHLPRTNSIVSSYL